MNLPGSRFEPIEGPVRMLQRVVTISRTFLRRRIATVSATLLMGCGLKVAEVRPTAAALLSCPEDSMATVHLENGWVASGCGSCALCECHGSSCACCPFERSLCARRSVEGALADAEWVILQPRSVRERLGSVGYLEGPEPPADATAPLCTAAKDISADLARSSRPEPFDVLPPQEPPDLQLTPSSIVVRVAAKRLVCLPEETRVREVRNGWVATGCRRCAACDCHVGDCVCCLEDNSACAADLAHGHLSEEKWNILQVRRLRHRGGPECFKEGR